MGREKAKRAVGDIGQHLNTAHQHPSFNAAVPSRLSGIGILNLVLSEQLSPPTSEAAKPSPLLLPCYRKLCHFYFLLHLNQQG
ncbi:hypothetical protein E2C01_092829 [Portunus trituberculatus]|uniref:Uncharacterized protein n=1 Tax=Portunus trituberculatus TaxID=210409 RepID=A0A5B7JHG2_PORTR|nr:hypothetical protein [Portunus trituberculatus]